MLSKESKIRTLENFHALDYVFFGKPITEIKSCCPLVKEEYMSIKGALLSVHIEMLKLIEHAPKVVEEKVDSSGLIKQAKITAKIARENSQAIVTTDKSREHIKQTLKGMFKEDKDMNIVEEMKSQIRQQAFSLAVDNLLIGRIVKESKAFDKLNEWEGVIIEDSYKILRSNLVESAYEILESKDEEEEKDDDTKEEKDEELEEGLKEKYQARRCANISKDIASFTGAAKKCKEKYKGNPGKIKTCVDAMKGGRQGLVAQRKSWNC